MREIKFRIIHKNKNVGIERLSKRGWEWMWYELNPDVGERWTKGVMESGDFIRNQFTGLKDKNGNEIYEGDILINPKLEQGIIVFHEAGFALECLRKNGALFIIPLTKGFIKNKEIIGNAELLK